MLWSADSNGSSSWAVIGEVVMFHLRDALYVDGPVDVERLRPIARLSKNNYTRCGDIFEMIRHK